MTRLLVLVPFFALAACDTAPEQVAQTTPQTAAPAAPDHALPPGHPPMDGAGHGSTGKAARALHTGTVKETMTSGSYTYLLLETPEETIWVAGPQTSLEVGQTVSIPNAMTMHGFTSPTLGRTFDEILFVQAIHAQTLSKEAKACHAPPEIPDIAEFEPLEGGLTVGELYADHQKVAGKEIAIRGQVVKFSPKILGTNWVHLQDGTGSVAGQNYDVALTTSDTVKVGDVVVARGVLGTDRDFGGGYHYDLLVENARLEVE